jgi:tripartite-type tricarboxylate transporter receptor subunit TctC
LRGICAALCVLLGCAAGALPAAAQTRAGYPAKPIRLIIPFAAGGASDYLAHLIERRWTDLARQEIVLDLRPGANGNVGLEAAARAAPDGYTLLLGSTGVIAINPSLYKGKLRVAPARDLVPITQIADLPSALVAHPSFPPRSAAGLIAEVKAKPGKFSFASPGVGSVNRLEMERFMQATGIRMVHRPYPAGLGHAVGSLLAGETAVMFVPLSTVAGEVRARKLKLLAVAAPQRVSAFPDVATLAEQGVPDMAAGLWHGVFAPKGTPPQVVATLHAMLEQVMAAPKVRFHLNAAGIAALTSKSPQEFAAFLRAETERWARVVKESGATPG